MQTVKSKFVIMILIYYNPENFCFYDKAMLIDSGIECQEIIIENGNLKPLLSNLGYKTSKSKLWQERDDLVYCKMINGQWVYYADIFDCINQREIHEIELTVIGVLNRVIQQLNRNCSN